MYENRKSYVPQVYSIQLYLAKFVTSIAMHLSIYREFQFGQNIMKFVNNHEEKFHQPYIPFTIGLTLTIFCFVFEFINMTILFSKPNVFFTVGSYLTVGLLISLSEIYYSKTIGVDRTCVFNKIMDANHALMVVNKSSDIKWADRTLISKIQRVLYKFLRAIYASLIFYFVPFLYIIFNQKF